MNMLKHTQLTDADELLIFQAVNHYHQERKLWSEQQAPAKPSAKSLPTKPLMQPPY